jgi:hypothetical protein
MAEGEIEGQGTGGEGEVESQASAQVVTDADGEVVSEGAGATTAAAPAEAYSWQGVGDYARQYGVDLPGNDAQALQVLLNAYRQSQQRNFYADYGQRMAPYADQIEAWVQQQRQAAAQPQGRPAWQPPEWDPRWINMVERDPQTGHVYAKPGVDPRIADKVVAYADWQDKFRANPGEFIQPMIEARAREIVHQEFASHSQNTTADSLVAENSNWMFAVQPNGAPVLHQDGSRVLSPAGQLYARAADQIWRSGVRDVRQCHVLARGVVENAVLRQHWFQAQDAAVGGPQAQQAAIPTSVGGAATRPAQGLKQGRADTQSGLSLRDRLNSRMKDFSDTDVAF